MIAGMRWLVAPVVVIAALSIARPDLAAATVPAPPGTDVTSTSGPEAPAAGPLASGDDQGAAVPAPSIAQSAPLLQIPTGCPTPSIA